MDADLDAHVDTDRDAHVDTDRDADSGAAAGDARHTTADGAVVVKLVVGGPYAAGKTTLVTTVADGASLVTTEEATTSAVEAARKGSTTVGMDFGVVRVDDGPRPVELHVVGTPGQERFAAIREVLVEGADVFLLVVDGEATDRFDEVRDHHRTLSRAGAPGIVVVNRPTEANVAHVRDALEDLGRPVVPCDVRELGEVKAAVVVALLQLRERVAEATVAGGG